ncbi:DUF3857 domain-containing protein [Adhaeribacter pallidiroseus]|uniref:DUF3857 domain-containing protein n=1 Tax=Adhaeribacter pallidiroseus TaxID=2072847 RepID=A0A369QI01_9BACT|nr:DUF3857 domain-containing protein [Adhaeribacter pallidiroseus]RDC64523.1 hypothetical protein AHMF7616_03137 [Adhaeribacter pallidiroseus]
MHKQLLLLFFCTIPVLLKAQDHGFKLGNTTIQELQMNSYPLDTAAHAVVLNEFGDSWISDDDDLNLKHEYKVRIKILDKQGLDQANFAIPVRKSGGKTETVYPVEGVTFNLENGQIVQTKFNSKTYLETKSKYYDLVKFTLPNVKVGSVIEIKYQLQSPFKFNFRRWEFQSDIPKIYTEYWAKIPGNYTYNMTLTSFYPLVKRESEIIKDCFSVGGGKSDCARYKNAMKDVPAFVEEDYMTARSNYLAALNFELAEVQSFDGTRNRYTKEWQDADQEMRSDSKFGVQLKRGKEVFKNHLESLLNSTPDSLQRAQVVYNFVKNWFRWNEVYGCFSEIGIKKAYDAKSGNVADINLALTAALQYAGLPAIPVILSTRANGYPIEVHPVISDFNYVIAQVKIKDKVYQLDATDPFLSFGMLPVHCLNGKGRAIPTKGNSYWAELKPIDKRRQVSLLNLTLQPDGHFTGNLSLTSSGYEALEDRKHITSYNNQEEYVKKLSTKWHDTKINNYAIQNLEELDKPITQTMNIEVEGFDGLNKNQLLLDPFFIDRWEKNPFTSAERLYPVDLGTAIEQLFTITIDYPQDFEAVSLPQAVAITLPNNGGKYLFQASTIGNRVSLSSVITLNKPLYSPQEYHYLKAFFGKVVQTYQEQIFFQKKVLNTSSLK